MSTSSGVQEQWICQFDLNTCSLDGAQMLVLTVTKGDNNPTDDIGLYNGLKYLKRSNIIGKVDGYLPYVGYVTIAMVSLSPCRCTKAKKCC